MIMAELWRIALGVSGIAGVVSFVLWSLYRNWLQLDIFQRMTKKQQFILFMTFFILTFLFALAGLGAWVVVQLNRDDDGSNGKGDSAKLQKVLTVSIQDVDLFKRSKKPVLPQESTFRTFAGDSEDVIVEKAAGWIAKTLDTMFPRTEPSLEVTVVLDLDKNSLEVNQEGKDNGRRDHFWMFSHSNAEVIAQNPKEHPTLEVASTAISEAIENGEPLMVHIDRAGYELGFAKFSDYGSSGPKIESPMTLKKQNDPELVVMFEEVEGSKTVAESLRGKLAELSPKLIFGTPKDYADNKKNYEKSSEATNRSFGNREATLQETRVDALVTITFSEKSISPE
jgi:hypothetical protein